MSHISRRSLFRGAALSAVLLSLCLSLSGCASALSQALREPDVRLVGAQLQQVDLSGADLLFEFEVDNPNGLALVLDQVGYQLAINGRHLLDGQRDERTEIAARTQSRIALPVTIRLDDAYQVLRSFSGRERTRPDYRLDANFRFAAPIVGGITVPVHKTGTVPLDRLMSYIPSR
jgi:LEA14-like dessication related protein